MPDTVAEIFERAAGRVRRHVDHPHRAAPLDLLLHRADGPTPLVYVRYPPTLSPVLAGRKRAIVGDDDQEWGTERFLITPVDLPVIAQVVGTGPHGDFLAVNWRLDPLLVAEVAAHVPGAGPDPEPASRLGRVTPELAEAVGRLLRLLDAPEEIPVLGAAVARELVLRLLQTDQAPRLLAAAALDRAGTVTRVIDRMTGALAEPWTLDRLAAAAGTSTPTLTRRFRQLTGMSPMQYLKRLRLGEARRRMVVLGDTAAHAATAVGYASPSHFTRDYRAAYETTPAADAVGLRTPRPTPQML